jgi:hypothetical protein
MTARGRAVPPRWATPEAAERENAASSMRQRVRYASGAPALALAPWQTLVAAIISMAIGALFGLASGKLGGALAAKA